MIKDYNDSELIVGRQDDYGDVVCSKCGDYMGSCNEDVDFFLFLCVHCFDDVFPEEDEK